MSSELMSQNDDSAQRPSSDGLEESAKIVKNTELNETRSEDILKTEPDASDDHVEQVNPGENVTEAPKETKGKSTHSLDQPESLRSEKETSNSTNCPLNDHPSQTENHNENSKLEEVKNVASTEIKGSKNTEAASKSSELPSEDTSENIVQLAADEITQLSVSSSETGQETSSLNTSASISLKNEDLSKSERQLKNLCLNMFAKLEGFLQGEVASSVDDYVLLEKMNKATGVKYENMLATAKSVVHSMHELNGKFSNLRLYLEQIDQIEQEALLLEQSAYKLDSYARRLEERFRKLEKR